MVVMGMSKSSYLSGTCPLLCDAILSNIRSFHLSLHENKIKIKSYSEVLSEYSIQ
jgi:hypothetical protein